MLTYITAFIFYTLAMIGILLVGFIVYKKMMINPNIAHKGMIKILDNYPIAPKKTLMVVKIMDEKFLIASGAEHTTFLAKLEDDNQKDELIKKAREVMSDIPKKPEITINDSKKSIQVEQIKQPVSIEKTEERYDELQQARLKKIQRQFNMLYNQEDKEIINDNPRQKNQKILTKILQELNATQNKA